MNSQSPAQGDGAVMRPQVLDPAFHRGPLTADPLLQPSRSHKSTASRSISIALHDSPEVCFVPHSEYTHLAARASHVAPIMASYFELPAQSKAPSAVDVFREEREQLRGMSLLSPQVSRILDDLQFDDKSSSSDGDEEHDSSSSNEEEESRLSDDDTKIDDSLSRKARQGRSGTAITAHGSKTSGKSTPKEIRSSLGRTNEEKSSKNPRSHMARFQSLRSTLFQANIENNMKKCHQEAEAREQAATHWKAQHEHRQGYNRPRTPEERAPHGKDRLGRRIGMKIRRLTSKEPSTMASIEESQGNLIRRESTASDDENEPYSNIWKPRQSYESSIDHSDIDDLVRWVSRRDPPSDGEKRMSAPKAPKKEDSGHESLGHSDIEELVRHASRKSISHEPLAPTHTSYSDESTASDSEQDQERDVQKEDILSRWVSRRDGAAAGPIHQQRSASQIEPDTENDSDVPEIGRWRTHHDDTSGESVVGSEEVTKRDNVSVLEAKRGRSRERSPRFEDRGHFEDDDIDELVRWVSRKESKQTSNPDIKNEATQLKRQEDAKKEQVGMTVDDKSLAPEDLDDLIAHVRSRKTSGLQSS